MMLLKIIFWLSLFIVFYSYLGYGILIWSYLKLASVLKSPSKNIDNSLFEPEVTLIVAIYNEEAFIRKKIENTLQLNYPPNKLKKLFIADGSTDDSVKIISEYPAIQLLFKPGREGKVAA